MGQRTTSETLSALIAAFWHTSVWKQADLAREVGVSARTVRRVLDELVTAGWPLEREEDHPHVFWSVPKGWFPGGVLFKREALGSLVRCLVRMPRSDERTKLLKVVTGHVPHAIAESLERVIPPRTSEIAEKFLPLLLDAVVDRRALALRYFVTSRGVLTSRVVSVQRVLIGPPTRFIAWCHESKGLRWFRVDSTADVAPSPKEPFVEVDDEEIDALINESVDGFHGVDKVRFAFFVRTPEARWVELNLPEGMAGRWVDNGLLVETETAGLLPIARFVVGLGDAAECRSPELATHVRQLAEAALANLRSR